MSAALNAILDQELKQKQQEDHGDAKSVEFELDLGEAFTMEHNPK